MKKWNLKKQLTIVILVVAGLAFIIPVQASKPMTAKDFVAECKPSIDHVTVGDARMKHNAGDWIFLDVRTEKEFKKGAIPNAVHMQRGLLEFKIAKKIPDKTAKIVVYCKSGSRSSLAVCTLKKMGYVNVVSMEGGWKGWLKDGHPIA
jgi:rhodanese-related sulfurtransferase